MRRAFFCTGGTGSLRASEAVGTSTSRQGRKGCKVFRNIAIGRSPTPHFAALCPHPSVLHAASCACCSPYRVSHAAPCAKTPCAPSRTLCYHCSCPTPPLFCPCALVSPRPVLTPALHAALCVWTLLRFLWSPSLRHAPLPSPRRVSIFGSPLPSLVPLRHLSLLVLLALARRALCVLPQ